MVKVTNKSKRLLGCVVKTDSIGQDLVTVNLKPGHNIVDEKDWKKVEKSEYVQRLIDAELIDVKESKKKKKGKGKKKSDLDDVL